MAQQLSGDELNTLLDWLGGITVFDGDDQYTSDYFLKYWMRGRQRTSRIHSDAQFLRAIKKTVGSGLKNYPYGTIIELYFSNPDGTIYTCLLPGSFFNIKP